MPSKIVVPLILAFLVMFAFAGWFNGTRMYTTIVPFPYSAEVLATKAREMLDRFGYQEIPADDG